MCDEAEHSLARSRAYGVARLLAVQLQPPIYPSIPHFLEANSSVCLLSPMGTLAFQIATTKTNTWPHLFPWFCNNYLLSFCQQLRQLVVKELVCTHFVKITVC